jgi:hypothetical protein
MHCAVCLLRFDRPSRFIEHGVQVHHLARGRFERIVNEHRGEDQWLVTSDLGDWFIAVQPPLV